MHYPEISIIVPVYKVEKYLDKCVQSIRAQTFGNLEIILIVDGSPDRCGEMCDTYAQEDARIKVIHKANGGQSDARNVGIDAAQGRYLGFVDSDDFIEQDMYETLYNIIIQENADVSECGFYDFYGEAKSITTNTPVHISVLNTEEAIRHTLQYTPAVWCRLYRKEIFEKIRFPIGKVFEDSHIIIYLLAQTKRMVVTDAKKYYYVHREGSVTNLSYCPQLLSTIEAWKNNYNFIIDKYPNLRSLAKIRYLRANFYVLDRMMLDLEKSDLRKQTEIVKLLRQNIWSVLKSSDFQTSRKIAALSLFVNQAIYRKCVLIYWHRHKPIG